jgi:Mitochondrial ribosomal protein L37
MRLKGLNYLKGRDDPVALEDEEYPEWLWRCLDVKKKGSDEEGAVGDLFCMPLLVSSSVTILPLLIGHFE